ncbi:hypothetical protein [Bremerella alba]|uniref:Uncharacterized protein n=1 Tax=Bremerella alba TaxID=980252 RepID=A0A7V8V5A3_9BACT|nr:hypothetical protein [Bremerella alba]MBA2115219.1 hypothetical protein [Bremerella alba]
MKDWTGKQYNINAAKNPELNLDITDQGLVFDYDIVYEGEIPPL